MRFVIITQDVHMEGQSRRGCLVVCRPRAGETLEPLTATQGEFKMREWHKPTVEETESGMEVTSYLPAELDRA
jgi:coenzyme PQQ precursor peptide PqqA